MNIRRSVYTIEEIQNLGLDKIGGIVKYLFLRDAKGRRYFLIMMQPDKKVDLKALQATNGSTPLRFASEERLAKYLGLGKGAVSPLGIINDADQAVEIGLDNGPNGHGLADLGRSGKSDRRARQPGYVL